MTIQSKNPATGEVLKTFEALSDSQIEEKLARAQKTFAQWRNESFATRKKYMQALAELLKKKKAELAKIMTLEMGKPITEAKGEVEKCAWCVEYYAENAEKFLADEIVETDASKSMVQFEPLGPVLAVMPWNYPFWQVIRFIAPAAMAGNVGLLKHASNVPQCALALEELFDEAGFPSGVFQTLLIDSKKVEGIIADERIQAVTLTGSEGAGSEVAMQAGKYLKKTVLELGGSNPFIVLPDADLDLAVEQCVKGRFQNTGQSCIAAKRFVVHEEIENEFTERFVSAVKELKMGDPLEEKTDIGPLYSKKGQEEIDRQVQESIQKGAQLLLGGKKGNEAFYEPTILSKVKKGMPAYDEETFGPVAAIISVKDEAEAIHVANDTPYGLGAAVFTKDIKKAEELAGKLITSCVFVNGLVKSDPRLPFGGIKKSGYGRELSDYGIREFVNIKTVWIR